MSTTVLERTGERRPASGGLTSRRAILRWSRRTVRREWRQQLLVLGLLSFAVAVLICGTTFVYNLPPPPEASFGSAERFIVVDAADRAATAQRLDAARRHFGTIEVIGFRYEQVPGSVEPVVIRAQDPSGVFGAPMLSVVDGRFPAAAEEVATTDDVAERLDLDVGDQRTIDGRARRVVGIVENPGDLDSEFVLVPPEHADPPQQVTVLFNGDDAAVRAFVGDAGFAGRPHPQRPNDKPLAAALALALGTVFLLFVCLMASAGFAVLAQRRLRQSGMLAAIGASQKHVRGVLAANGTVTGVLSSLIGLPLGYALWAVASPLVERAEAHRVDRLALPWALVAVGIMLAIVAATLAAWWPGRALARLPVAAALSARPPRPRPAHRSTLAGAVCAAVGVESLVASNKNNALFIITGTLAVVLAIVLVAPAVVRAVGRTAGRLPFAARVAVRDLARYQARSSAALAAITLALSIVMAVVIGTSIALAGAGDGNLPPDQIRVSGGAALGGGSPQGTIGGSQSAASVEPATPTTEGAVQEIAAAVGGSVTTLYHAVDPEWTPPSGVQGSGLFHVAIGQQTGERIAGLQEVHVADRALLELYGVDQDDVPDDVEVITPDRYLDDPGEEFEFIFASERIPVTYRTIDLPAYSSLPTTLITEAAMRRHGWDRESGGWLITSPGDLTDAEVTAAMDAAARYGLEIETRRGSVHGTVRAGALAAGALLAFAILSMTVGLIRAEAAADLRTLTAAGASRSVRRRIGAATTAMLAVCGVVIGTLAADVFAAAWLHDELYKMGRVPWISLLVALVGLPLAAAAGGWLFAGRQPSAIVRRAIE